MTTAARVDYAPCRPVWQLSPPANHPLRRKGGGIGSLAGGVLSIITKSCPDDHLRIETDAPELRIGRPSLARPRHSTPRRGRRVATCNRPQTLSTPLERGSVVEVHLDPVAPRGGVIEEQRLAFRAG